MNPEPVVMPLLVRHVLAHFTADDEAYLPTGYTHTSIADALGINPDMSMARLRDDLSIASAARTAYNTGGIDGRSKLGRLIKEAAA
jgi:hypothetical protein